VNYKQAIDDWCKRSGTSYSALSCMCNVNRGAIRSVLNGVNFLSIALAVSLEEVTGIRAVWLLREQVKAQLEEFLAERGASCSSTK
jgi:transcriptional regulator with XRE-family HTH domain